MIVHCEYHERLDILGVPLSVLDSYQQTVGVIVDRVRAGQKTLCVAVNPEKIHNARRNKQLLSLLQHQPPAREIRQRGMAGNG